MDETLSQPLPLPRARRTMLTTLLVAVLAFVLGAGVVVWLAASGRLAGALPAAAPTPSPGATTVPPAARLARPTRDASMALGGVETRLALLEDRLSRIDGEATAASANAARAEALLIAYAARRKIDKGEPLGFVEEQLRLRFGGAQPEAVQTIIAAARVPITLDNLSGKLEAIAPALSGTARDESTWTRVRRELSSLFVVRRAPTATTAPGNRVQRARLLLASGQVDDAVAEIERLPGAASAQAWIEAARRYGDTRRALDVIETAAMLESRTLRDGAGNTVEQRSPLAPPPDAPPTAAAE